ncbi:MAG TPA: ATPase, partial [Cyanobacteria bacterium UBA11148]|nr:ATPase [Cyanobacteria bacterium UBA11148]
QDLSEMPDLGAFYDRTPELDTLTTWILQQHCRLIALTGISGIGKTTLAVQLVQQIKDEFEYVIWWSLYPSPTLTEFQDKLIQFLSQSDNLDSPATNQKPLPLIKYLQKHRCLVVLDDIHSLFSSGELAGKYKPGYENYRSFFKQVEQLSHQSCFLLIGWEQSREIPQTNSQNTPIRTLKITGLDIPAAQEILRDYELAEIENYSALILRYQGNPLWLQTVATLIQELAGCEHEILLDDTILLPERLKNSLHQQLSRLSEIEKQVLSLLAQASEPIKRAKLLQNTLIPPSDLLNALQSLSRRSLIEQQADFYTMPLVVRQYVNSTFT